MHAPVLCRSLRRRVIFPFPSFIGGIRVYAIPEVHATICFTWGYLEFPIAGDPSDRDAPAPPFMP